MATIEKKKKTAPKMSDVLDRYQTILDKIMQVKDSSPEEHEMMLETAYKLYSEFAENRLITKLYLGVVDFEERLKSRVNEEPFTMQKLQSIHDELDTLANVLKI